MIPDAKIAVPSPAPSEAVEQTTPVTAPAEQAEVGTDGTEEAVASGDFEAIRQAAIDKALGRKSEKQPTKEPAPAADKPADEAKSTEKADEPTKAEPAPAKPKKSADERVQQVLIERARERQEHQQEVARLRQEIEQIAKGATAKPEPVKAAAVVQEPQRGDYDTLEAYEQAWREHPAKVVQSLLAAEREAERTRSEAEQLAQYEAELNAGWEVRVGDAIESAADAKAFEADVIRAAQLFTGHRVVTEFIMGDPLGPAMAAHLGKNLSEARELVKLTNPAKIAAALADLKNEVRAPKQAESPKVVTLPKPIPRASIPPPQLSTADSSEVDIADHQVAAGDFAAFRQRAINEALSKRRR